jgi:hypothetical protein
MRYTIKRYDFIKKENFVEEIIINEIFDSQSLKQLRSTYPDISDKLADELHNEFPDSTISIQWKTPYSDEINSINLMAKNQKIDEELVESGKMEWSEYAQKWYGSSFSTEFLKGLTIKKK